MNKENTNYPPIRFPRKLRDDLQSAANDLAEERGRMKMSIAELVAEMFVDWKANNLDAEEEG